MPEPDMSIWTGRVDVADGPRALRWHQMIKPLQTDSAPGFALIGFDCDEGVRRNGGRIGAKDGPREIRAALVNFAWHQPLPVYDTGDVRCDDSDMEGAQSRLAEVVASVIRAGHRPLILGGGHETAWGTFQGLQNATPRAAVGVINIDAHLDLRADEPGNSGTQFYQMAKWCKANDRQFRYLAIGISAHSNTAALFDRAEQLGVEVITDVECHGDEPFNRIAAFANAVESIHLSIDLDVLPAWAMPAVSAPAARGISLDFVDSLIGVILDTGKTRAVDLVELSPRFDIADRSVRTAARLVWDITLQ